MAREPEFSDELIEDVLQTYDDALDSIADSLEKWGDHPFTKTQVLMLRNRSRFQKPERRLVVLKHMYDMQSEELAFLEKVLYGDQNKRTNKGGAATCNRSDGKSGE